MDYKEAYKRWVQSSFLDKDTIKELKSIENNEDEIKDRFYKELEFGTAGLRGKIGAGTNRMNIYNISKVTQGLAYYILKQDKCYAERGVVIAFDCRHFSKEFAKTAALVLCANGIKTYLFEDLRPTPELSFAVRKLHASAGIVITASHNPKEYNGYKVYWEDGAQILSYISDAVLKEISGIRNFEDVKIIKEKEALKSGLLNIIGKQIDDDYIRKVKELSIRDDIDKDIKIVYTPLNGAGNIPVRRVLRERGFNNITVVPEQESPDPDFTTVGYPNPEDTKAFKYAENLGSKVGAELLIATDPDSDRLAIEVRNKYGVYISFNGNQTGAVLVNYICEGLEQKGNMPQKPAIVKSIVTSDLGKIIAQRYGVKTFESLTGFKNICGREPELEKKGYNFILGYEESIGYVRGTFVRDKDGISTAMLLCEAAAYYKTKGKSLIDVLNDIYEKYGYYREKPISLVLEGIEGKKRIERMMAAYRRNFPKEINTVKLVRYIDYKEGKEHDLTSGETYESEMPKSDVLRFFFEDGSWYAVRPSGTEPKIKIYIYSNGKSIQESDNKLEVMKDVIMGKINSVK